MIPLVMSIIAKTETFQRDMARAGGHVKGFEKQVKRSQVSVAGLSRSILRLAGVGGGLYMLQRGLRGTISAAMEQEKAENLLRAAIGGNIDSMKAYAASMQKMTVYGDEQILSQMAYGRNLGVTTDKLQEATTAAIGLAAKFRLDLASAMMLVGRASQGQTQLLTRYGIVLEETLSPQEKFNELLKIGADAFYLAQKQTEDTAGAYAQFKNNISDLAEAIGNPLLNKLNEQLVLINKNRDAWQAFFHANMASTYELMDAFTNLDELFKKINPDKWPMTYKELGEKERKLMYEALDRQAETTRKRQAEEGKGKMRELGIPMTQEEMDRKIAEMNFIGPPKPSTVDLKKALKEKTETSETDIAQNYVRMFDAINEKSKESYEWRFRLIEKEYDVYKQKADDIVLVERLKQERIKQLQIEEAKATGGFIEGFGAGIQEMDRDLQTIGELGAEVAKTFRDDMVDGLNEALWRAEDFKDVMKELEITVAKMVTHWLIMQAVQNTMSAIGNALGIGGGAAQAATISAAITTAGTAVATEIGTSINIAGGIVATNISSQFLVAGETVAASIAAAMAAGNIAGAAHYGGIAGKTSFQSRNVPSSTFLGAPRLHSGLMHDEFPAILQEGEQVIPRNKKGINTGIENKLDSLISLLSQRQTINANIIDKRDIVTKERMEGREGESWVMRQIKRNS